LAALAALRAVVTLLGRLEQCTAGPVGTLRRCAGGQRPSGRVLLRGGEGE
jgi:hypothetical protein